MFNIPFDVTVKGFEGKTISLVVTIGKVSFDYFMGVGHLKLVPKILPSHLRIPITTEELIFNRIIKDDRDAIIYRKFPVIVRPDLLDVCECLFLDSDAHDYSFDEWCDNFGLSNDSIKAKGMYDDCNDNYFKLRKALGKHYDDVKKAVEERNE